ncbi:MAG: thiamine phosphate synthase [candidate division NC10 bacterium]|nr:thiamine phosphate synthase [candidate division NC10 bacterium]
MDLSLYVITDSRLFQGRSHIEIARAAIAGGATAIQFREKGMSTRQMIDIAREIRALTLGTGVTYIVNDRVDVALGVDADGVHVGQDDMPASLARRLIGKERILGVSASNLEEALKAEREGADYIGVGSIYSTASKPDAGLPVGLGVLAEIARRVSIPVIAIGGIKEENVGEVIKGGARGVAVISAVVLAPDMEEATRRLRQRIEEARGNARQ